MRTPNKTEDTAILAAKNIQTQLGDLRNLEAALITRRNRAVVALSNRGWTPTEIAVYTGIVSQTVRDILKSSS